MHVLVALPLRLALLRLVALVLLRWARPLPCIRFHQHLCTRQTRTTGTQTRRSGAWWASTAAAAHSTTSTMLTARLLVAAQELPLVSPTIVTTTRRTGNFTPLTACCPSASRGARSAGSKVRVARVVQQLSMLMMHQRTLVQLPNDRGLGARAQLDLALQPSLPQQRAVARPTLQSACMVVALARHGRKCSESRIDTLQQLQVVVLLQLAIQRPLLWFRQVSQLFLP